MLIFSLKAMKYLQPVKSGFWIIFQPGCIYIYIFHTSVFNLRVSILHRDAVHLSIKKHL